MTDEQIREWIDGFARAAVLAGKFSDTMQEFVRVANASDPEIRKMASAARALERQGVYGEWCRDPVACIPRGFCPKDPTCAD